MSRVAVIPTDLAMNFWRTNGAFIKDVQPDMSPFMAMLKRKKDADAKSAPLPFDDLPPEAA